MMKFLIAIAMVALIGFSLTSAAAVDMGDNNVAPEAMDGFKENLQSLLREVSKQIEENVNFKDASDIESFIQENKIDDELDSIVTDEEEEFMSVGTSDAEDDQSDENIESGIRCRWRGLAGKCCQRIRIFRRLRLTICLVAKIAPPTRIQVALEINGKTLCRHTVVSRHSYNFCVRKGRLRFCFKLNNLYVTSHSARVCLRVSVSFHRLRIRKRLGCIYRRFADEEISTPNEETPLQLLEKDEHIYDRFLVPNEKKPTDNVLRFDH